MTKREKKLRSMRHRQKLALKKLWEANDLLTDAVEDLCAARNVANDLWDDDTDELCI